MVLSKLQKGQVGLITKINTVNSVERRLNDLGIRVGIRTQVIRVAPFGSPIEIRVGGFYLAIRRQLANNIEIEIESGK